VNDGELICNACYPHLIVYGEVVPGYVLGRLPPDVSPWRGMLPGHYALFIPFAHEPAFVWEVVPVAASDDDDQERRHGEAVEAMEPQFRCGPATGYHLVKACLEAGYRWENSGMPLYWLADRMARMIAEADR
jgi:hypothetical protein